MNSLYQNLSFGMAIFMIALFPGCYSTRDIATPVAQMVSDEMDHLKVNPGIMKNELPVTVAILPFENRTKAIDAQDRVRKSFFNQFSSKKYNDIELHRINVTLAREQILDNMGFINTPKDHLGRLLKADGLIFGTIISYDTIYIGAYSRVSVELEAKLIQAKTGKILWQGKHRTSSHEGGIPLDPINLIPTLFRTLVNVSDMEMLKTCDKLSRIMVATIPEPDIGSSISPPKIELVAHDARGKWKKAGDDIMVTLKGQPGMAASFDIGETIRGVLMSELERGIYQGTYQVRPGDLVKKGMVTARLTNEKGNSSTHVDPLGLINIDTLAPDRPERVTARSQDRSVFLEWHDNNDPDLAGYKVYKSLTPKTGYDLIKETQLNLYHDQHLKNFQPCYYKISSIDTAGNESPPTEPLAAMPVKPGPTNVMDNISLDIVWYAGASPYIITKPVTILNKASLTIEPGCKIESQGPGLIVKGRLTARGNPEDYIQFSSIDKDSNAPGWQGILFDNTSDSESVLSYCKIKGAHTALTMVSSSPEISHCIFTENNTAIYIKEFSCPGIYENRIIQNLETGIYSNRSEPVIEKNTITENKNHGIIIASGSPVIQNNNIYKNTGFDLLVESSGSSVLSVQNNWWGTKDVIVLSDRIKGSVSYASIMDGPWPHGKPMIIILPDQIKQQMAQARNLFKKNDFSSAKQILSKILAHQPDHDTANFLIGLIWHGEGNLAKALYHIQTAAFTDPENTKYLYTLGMVYKETGDTAKAVEQWKKVVIKDPLHTNAKTLLQIYDK
jgi:parallel beta-helix repeat protein